jgi:DNA polymerase-3 subunit delta
VSDVAYLVKGNDPLLRSSVVDALVNELLGDDDRSLALEEFTVPGRASDTDDESAPGGTEAREAVVGAVLNAAASPPFMTARRIVVLRDAGALTAADADRLGGVLEEPLDSTVLVFVAGGGTLPAALVKKLKEVGARERAPDSEKTSDVLADAAASQQLRLRPDAVKLVSSHLGDDAGRVASLVDALHAAYGDDATLSVDDVAPYLGEAGAVPTYQLTNAIEAGDEAAALEVLHRLLTASSPQQPRPMHPLQVLGSLNGHYRRMLRLDDPEVHTPADAVAALGGRVKEYPARKALDGARALGVDGLRQAFDALHQADLDLKGARGIPPDAVVEVLVVRLARLTRASGRRAAGRRR